VCVLSSVCVAVFDRDELICFKLLCIYRKFCHVLLVVWVDPSLFPALPQKRIWLQKNATCNQVVDLGEGRFTLSSQQFGGTGKPYQETTIMTLHTRKTSHILTSRRSRSPRNCRWLNKRSISFHYSSVVNPVDYQIRDVNCCRHSPRRPCTEGVCVGELRTTAISMSRYFVKSFFAPWAFLPLIKTLSSSEKDIFYGKSIITFWQV